MKYSSFIAKRYLKSKQLSKSASFITNIAIGGIALGVAIVLIALTIFEGFDKAVTDKIIQMDSHIKITGFGGRNLTGSNKFTTELKKHFNNSIKEISPFVSRQALIKSRKTSEGISLQGVSHNQFNSLKKYLIGKPHTAEINVDERTIIIGKKLADKLFIKTGDEVTIFALQKLSAPSEDNPPIIDKFRVAYIYESGMAEYDDLNAYIRLDVAQSLFLLKNEVSGYDIRIKNVKSIKPLTEQIKNFVRYPYYVRSIFKIHQNIFTWLALQKKPVPIILGLIIIVAVFNIIGTLLMIVLEKVSSIGTLQAMGATRKNIISIFLTEGIIISTTGILLGNALALVLSLLQKYYNIIPLPSSVYFLSSVPISINAFNYLLVSSLAFLLSISAAYLPSKIAANISPIEAINFN